MLRLSAKEALNKTMDIKIPAPACSATIRESVASLRAKAVEAKAALKMEISDVPDDKSGGMMGALGGMAGSKLGGMAGGLVAAAGEIADTAIDKVGDVAELGAQAAGGVAGATLEASLNALADLLEAPLDEFEKPFETVASEIATPKKDQLFEVYEKYIDAVDVVDPTHVVRGKSTTKDYNGKPTQFWGQAEYDAVPPTGLSTWFVAKSQKDMEDKLMPEVAEAVAAHKLTNLSQNLIESYNKVGQSDVLAKVGLSFAPMEFNIGQHIVHHTVLSLGSFITENEEKFRKDSADKSDRLPTIFAKIYSGQELFLLDYELFLREKKPAA